MTRRSMQAALWVLTFAGLSSVAAEAGTARATNPRDESGGHRVESLQEEGYVTLRIAPRPLGEIERGEARITLTREELKDMGISSLRSLGGAFDVNDLSEISEVGSTFTYDADRIQGRLKTALGGLGFQSAVQEDGRIRVEFDLGGQTAGMLVDHANLVAVPLYSESTEITPAHKFAFRALAVVLKQQTAVLTPEADTLLRTTNVFAELVPVGPARAFFRDRVITPEIDRSWTTMCGWTSANLCHDASTHSLQCFNVAVGPNAYRCRGRCGSGCDAIIGTSAWTVDCGEHDHCLEAHYNGECFYCGSCGDEANSAQDDFLFAGNCRY